MRTETKARALLAAQFIALGILALPRRRTQAPRPRAAQVAGVVFSAGGATLAAAGALALGSDLRPLPIPRDDVRLRDTGPYRFFRHPIYTGITIGAVGRSLMTGRSLHAWTTGALIGIFHLKAELEERLLADVVDYSTYRRAVPRWGLGLRK